MVLGPEALAAWIVFAASIALVVSRRVEEPLAGLAGVSILIISGLAGLGEAFGSLVDWNVISILLGMWMISHHMVEAGFPQLVVSKLSALMRSSRSVVLVLSTVAGLISTVVDNVLVILLIAPIALRVARAYGIDPVPTVLMVALTANATGTALLLGDLPPQLLHSVFGAEFLDFIHVGGRPSSFPILMASVFATLYIVAAATIPRRAVRPEAVEADNKIERGYLAASLAMFSTAIALMALRAEISYLAGREIPLGLFPLSVGILGSLALEILWGKSFKETVERGIDWGAVLFYISLFILVGSLEKLGGLEPVAAWLSGILSNRFEGYTLIYWISAPVVALVEHDAYILVMLKSIKDSGVHDPWPFAWSLLWAGTLGSNYTAAGAPALYVAFRIAEKDLGRRLRPGEIYRTTALYSTTSLAIAYAISLPIWGI